MTTRMLFNRFVAPILGAMLAVVVLLGALAGTGQTAQAAPAAGPIISDLSTTITAPAEVTVGEKVSIDWGVDLPGDPPFFATLNIVDLEYTMGKTNNRIGGLMGITQVFTQPGVITATAVITPLGGVIDPELSNNTAVITITVLNKIEPIEGPILTIFLPLVTR